VWLYRGDVGLFSERARGQIEREELFISPAVVLELEYLAEIRAERPSALTITAALEKDLGVRVCDLPFEVVVRQALLEKWGRDPFDRLIVAQAKANQAPLVTKDERIQRHYEAAVW
jgi:PIN domain nuclease of toxin-antitoxin system